MVLRASHPYHVVYMCMCHINLVDKELVRKGLTLARVLHLFMCLDECGKDKQRGSQAACFQLSYTTTSQSLLSPHKPLCDPKQSKLVSSAYLEVAGMV